MKFKIILFVLVIGLFFSQTVNLANAKSNNVQDIAHKKFKDIVNNFNQFFKSSPMLVRKGLDIWADKITFAIDEHVYQSVGYDIMKTNSIVSPLTGYIFVDTIVKDNSACGNVQSRISDQIVGYDNIESAINNATIKECFINDKIERNRFIFSYEDSKWKFKQVKFFVIETKEILNNDHFMAVFRIEGNKYHLIVSEPEGIKFNRKWQNLIKKYL